MPSKETLHHMLTTCLRLETLEELRDYVNAAICDYEELEVGAFQMTERILVRSGSPCGVFFCIHGPRQVKFTAIWETDNNTIIFYGSTGERVFRTRLTDAPTLLEAA